MRHRYRIVQGGLPVASAEGPGAMAEILHYARVYGQDGPVTLEYHHKGRWKVFGLPEDEYITIPRMRMGLVPKDEAKGQL